MYCFDSLIRHDNPYRVARQVIDNQPSESETISVSKDATEASIPIPIVIAAKLEDLRTAEKEASIPIPVVIAQSLNDLSESEALYGH